MTKIALVLQLISFATSATSFVPPNVKRRTTTRSIIVHSHAENNDNNDGPPPSADSLLYEEQEKLLIATGETEALLMTSDRTPQGIQPNIVKGTGSTGGFGGGGGGTTKGKAKKKAAKKRGGSNAKNIAAQAKEHAKILLHDGVVRIDNVLPPALADDLRSYVYDLRAESEELVRSSRIAPLERFANVLLRGNRCDLTLPLGDAVVADALRNVLQESPVGRTVGELFGDGAVLYELSCLISDPGSSRQNVHPDTPCIAGEEAVLYTCFVALQDITIDMGPTTWIPNSHTVEAHADFRSDYCEEEGGESRKDRLLRTKPCVLGLLPKGSCGIFDSRLLHCGGANRSEDQSRALFYVSFKNPRVGYPGNPGSIRRDYISKFTLEMLDEELTRYKKGKQSVLLV